MTNMNEVINGITLSKACSIKADKDSDTSKTVTLRVKFDGATIQDVFNKAMNGIVIQWQNGPGRKKWATWRNGQVVNVDFKAPGKTAVDPKDQLIAEAQAAGIDVNDRDAMKAFIMERMGL